MQKVCHQYKVKIKKQKLAGGFIPVDSFEIFSIKQIDFAEAKNFILQYEWLKNIGSAKYCYGLYFDNNLASVACYTSPVSPNGYKKILGEEDGIILQLCRGASSYWAPKWASSKIIATSLKIVHKQFGAIAVVAYADPKAGEIGTIYQACNATYIGLTNSGGAKTYIINGTKYHPRKIHKLYGSRKSEVLKKIDPNFKTIEIKPKHRYIFLLGSSRKKKEFLSRISNFVEPYPKREK